jgi:hypothetical protein
VKLCPVQPDGGDVRVIIVASISIRKIVAHPETRPKGFGFGTLRKLVEDYSRGYFLVHANSYKGRLNDAVSLLGSSFVLSSRL